MLWTESCPYCRESPVIAHDLEALRFGICVPCRKAWYEGISPREDWHKPASMLQVFMMTHPEAVAQVMGGLHFEVEKPLDPDARSVFEQLHVDLLEERRG